MKRLFVFVVCAGFTLGVGAQPPDHTAAPQPKAGSGGVADGVETLTIPGQNSGITACHFINDNQILVNANVDGNNELYIWDIAQKKKVREFESGYPRIDAESNTLVYGTISTAQKTPPKILDLRTGEHTKLVEKPFEGLQYRPEYSRDGKFVVAQSKQTGDAPKREGGFYGLSIWRRDGGFEKTLPFLTGINDQYQFSPDGKTVAVGVTQPPSIVMIDVDSGKVTELKSLTDKLNAPVKAMQFSPDGKHLAIATNRLIVADAKTGAVTFDYQPKRNGKNSVPVRLQFSPKGNKLAFGFNDYNHPADNGVEMIDFPPGADTKAKRLPGLTMQGCFSFTPNGERIAASGLAGNGFVDLTQTHLIPTHMADRAISEEFLKQREAEKQKQRQAFATASQQLSAAIQKEGKERAYDRCYRNYNQHYPVAFEDDNNTPNVKVIENEKRSGTSLELSILDTSGMGSPVVFKSDQGKKQGDRTVWEGTGTRQGYEGPDSIRVRVEKDDAGFSDVTLVNGPRPVFGVKGGKEYQLVRYNSKGEWVHMTIRERPGKPTAFLTNTSCGDAFGEPVSGRWKGMNDYPAPPLTPRAPRNTDIDPYPKAVSAADYLKARREHLKKEAAYNDLLEKFPTPKDFERSPEYRARLRLLGALIPDLPEVKSAPAAPAASSAATPPPTQSQPGFDEAAWQRGGGSVADGIPQIFLNERHPVLTPGVTYRLSSRGSPSGALWKYTTRGWVRP